MNRRGRLHVACGRNIFETVDEFPGGVYFVSSRQDALKNVLHKTLEAYCKFDFNAAVAVLLS